VNESEDKEFGKSISNAQETSIYLDLSNKSWHVFNDAFGTSEEKYFIKYIDKIYNQLREKYDEVYLVRNEKFFKIYNFDDGKPFEPDYVLFLNQKTNQKSLYYQVFIEPKGGHLKQADAWKENFLKSLKKEHKIEQLWKDRKYIVWGMPFYNNSEEGQFDAEVKGQLL
jgi:type III restriction enzyme